MSRKVVEHLFSFSGNFMPRCLCMYGSEFLIFDCTNSVSPTFHGYYSPYDLMCSRILRLFIFGFIYMFVWPENTISNEMYVWCYVNVNDYSFRKLVKFLDNKQPLLHGGNTIGLQIQHTNNNSIKHNVNRSIHEIRYIYYSKAACVSFRGIHSYIYIFFQTDELHFGNNMFAFIAFGFFCHYFRMRAIMWGGECYKHRKKCSDMD